MVQLGVVVHKEFEASVAGRDAPLRSARTSPRDMYYNEC